jgi:uncharacterized integral membrane protein
MRALWIGGTLLLAIAAGLFAVSNDGTVALGIWPVPDALHLPLYLVVLVALAIGFLFGRFTGWLAHGRIRRERRKLRRHVETLQAAPLAATTTHASRALTTV